MRFLGRRYLPAEGLPARVSVMYLIAGIVWIVASDRILDRVDGLLPNGWDQTIKGLLYIGVTAFALYLCLRRLTRETLRSHQHLASALGSIGDAVIATDPGGCVWLMNQAAEKLTGTSFAAAEGRSLDEILEIVDGDGKKMPALVDRVSRERAAVRFEGRMRSSSSGEMRHIGGVATPMFDPSGASVGVVSVIRDITPRVKGQEAVRRSKQELETIFDSVPAYIFYKDRNSVNLRVNKAFADAMGRSQDDFVGKSTYELFPDEAEEMVKDDIEVVTTGRPKLNVIRPYTGLNGTRMVKVDKIPYQDVDGNIVGVLGVASDITDLQSAREALSRQEQEYRLLFTSMSEAFAVLEYAPGGTGDPGECRLIEVNKAFVSLVGVGSTHLIGRKLKDLYPSMDEDWASAAGLLMRSGQPARFEGYISPIGKYVRGIAYCPGKNRVAVIVIDDTDRRRTEERVRFLSYHDKLTGINNRAYLEDRLLGMGAEDNLPLSILVADVNGLKLINDAFGHSEGDKYLRAVASSLKECCSEKDVVARWGGDEFAIVLPNTPESAAGEAVRKIEEEFEFEHHRRPGGTLTMASVRVGITLGHATRTDPGEDIMETMKRAESEMYKRKFLRRTNIRNSMIMSLREMLNARTHETHEHASRLAELALRIARLAGLSDRDQNELSLLAVLHDIGKIGIPDRILEKPGYLTPEEWDVMRTHCVIGYRIASATPDLAPIATAILHHHERWDGSGYPEGLSGEEIPIICRILAIVDAFDALTHDRPYRSGLPEKDALAEIRAGAGTQFDPRLVDLFLDLVESRAAG